MGLLDLPAPLFSAFDGLMGTALPPVARLGLWALLGAVVSMELYRLLSPQERIATLRTELDVAQRKVSAFDGEFAEAWPLIRRMLSLAFKRIGVVLPGTVLASLPVLTLLIWLDTAYGYSFPPSGETVAVDVAAPFTGRWQSGGSEGPRALVLDGGRVVVDQRIGAAVPVVAKRHWWNVLIGNPAGYLDRNAPVDNIAVKLPAKQVIAFGPAWMRGWEPAFFGAIIIFAFALKRMRHIE